MSANLEIGKLIAGKGVFMGQWEPKDRSGNSLGKKFNVFAAPEDLTDSSGQKMILQFKDAAVEVAKLRNWNGHDGVNCDNDTAVYNGLMDGTAVGKWFIPPRELVQGKDVDGTVVRAQENLYALRNTGDFAGTFTTVNNGTFYVHWYWSSTERRGGSAYVYNVDFTDGDDDWNRDGDDDWNRKVLHRLSCRPCRVELVI